MFNENLLRFGDVIEVKKGMKVYANIPEKFVIKEHFRSNKKVEAVILIGKIIKSQKFPFSELRTSLAYNLNNFRINVKENISEIDNFINSLNVDSSEDSLDTSLYEGKYFVYFADIDNTNNYRVYCEKQDSSGIIISFYQTGEKSAKIENIKPLIRGKIA